MGRGEGDGEMRPVGAGTEPTPVCPQELEQQGSIHTKGCVGQFEKWLQDNLIIVAGVFVGIALLQVQACPHSFTPGPPLPRPADGLSLTHSSSEQIFGICLAQNLVSDIQAVKANW